MSELHKISGCDNAPRKGDVIFIHGLGGDAFGTWRHGDNESTSWPHWLGEEFPDMGVWSLGYAASPTRWTRFRGWFSRNRRDSGQSMPLPDRGLQVLDLMAQRGLGPRPILFVCHSLGGLLAKQILRMAADCTDSRKKGVFTNTRGVLFLATPHAGASLASLVNAFRTVFGATVNIEDLRAHDAHLRELLNWYRNHSNDIRTVTYFETRDVLGVRIVNETSAHPGVGTDPVGLDEDHLSIAKPRHSDAQVCGALRDLLRNHVLGPPSSTLNRVVPIPQNAASTIQRTFACQFREFRGRRADLDTLERVLLKDPKHVGVVIGALGGMGKTALANQFCTAYGIERFFEIIIGASAKKNYLDVGAFDIHHSGVRPTDHAIQTIREYLLELAGQLGLRDPGARSDAKLEEEIRTAIHERTALFLLDNLETIDETAAALDLLRRLCLPPTHKFLITTRKLSESLGQGVASIPLNRLETNDARLLVRDLLEDLDQRLAASTRDDNAAVSAILKRAEGHPLALRLLTGKLVAQGQNAILSMPDPSKATGKEEWSGEFFGFVFDQTFLSYLQPIAVDVACVVASYAQGITERTLVEACKAADSKVTPELLDEAIGRLLRTFCVHREHTEGKAVPVLAMHPLTREFFLALSNEPS